MPCFLIIFRTFPHFLSPIISLSYLQLFSVHIPVRASQNRAYFRNLIATPWRSLAPCSLLRSVCFAGRIESFVSHMSVHTVVHVTYLHTGTRAISAFLSSVVARMCMCSGYLCTCAHVGAIRTATKDYVSQIGIT